MTQRQRRSTRSKAPRGSPAENVPGNSAGNSAGVDPQPYTAESSAAPPLARGEDGRAHAPPTGRGPAASGRRLRPSSAHVQNRIRSPVRLLEFAEGLVGPGRELLGDSAAAPRGGSRLGPAAGDRRSGAGRGGRDPRPAAGGRTARARGLPRLPTGAPAGLAVLRDSHAQPVRSHPESLHRAGQLSWPLDADDWPDDPLGVFPTELAPGGLPDRQVRRRGPTVASGSRPAAAIGRRFRAVLR